LCKGCRLKLDIGERAGSGIPGIVATWEKVFKTKPEYEQKYSPSRIKMVLDIAEFVEKSSDKAAITEESSEKSSEKNEKSGQESGQENEKSRQKSGQKNEKSRQKIVSLMAENPNITTFEMANKLNMSRSGITKQIAILQEQNIIRRVGPDKGGHWEIVEK
jgi:predicted HTH transcriptional regulator